MSILLETNKFHHGAPPCSGVPGQLPPLPPPLNPDLVAGVFYDKFSVQIIPLFFKLFRSVLALFQA